MYAKKPIFINIYIEKTSAICPFTINKMAYLHHNMFICIDKLLDDRKNEIDPYYFNRKGYKVK